MTQVCEGSFRGEFQWALRIESLPAPHNTMKANYLLVAASIEDLEMDTKLDDNHLYMALGALSTVMHGLERL